MDVGQLRISGRRQLPDTVIASFEIGHHLGELVICFRPAPTPGIAQAEIDSPNAERDLGRHVGALRLRRCLLRRVGALRWRRGPERLLVVADSLSEALHVELTGLTGALCLLKPYFGLPDQC